MTDKEAELTDLITKLNDKTISVYEKFISTTNDYKDSISSIDKIRVKLEKQESSLEEKNKSFWVKYFLTCLKYLSPLIAVIVLIILSNVTDRCINFSYGDFQLQIACSNIEKK